jgi:hypothetical protein
MTVYFADVEGYRYREIATMTTRAHRHRDVALGEGPSPPARTAADVSTQRQRVSTVTGA